MFVERHQDWRQHQMYTDNYHSLRHHLILYMWQQMLHQCQNTHLLQHDHLQTC